MGRDPLLETMMAESRTCPFCNTLLPAAVGGIRLVCPRCGESSIPITSDPAATALSKGDSFSNTSVAATRCLPRQIVLAAALVLVALAVGIATETWWSTEHSTLGDVQSGADYTVAHPADLSGLGYLPDSTEAILAVHLPALVEKFEPESQDPRKALVHLGLPGNVIETLDKLSGVGLKNVDQLVVGMGFARGSFPPQVVVVVHTRQPYDMTALADEHGARSLKKEGRTLRAVKAGPLPEVYWWGPNNRVLVATLLARDFENVPRQPVPELGQLKSEIATLVRERVDDDAVVWLVASSDRWAQHLRPYTFPWAENLGRVNFVPLTPLEGRNDLLGPAERLRSISVSVPQSPDRPVDIQIELQTASAASELRGGFMRRFAGDPVEVTGDAEICRLQTPFERARVGFLIGGLVGPAK